MCTQRLSSAVDKGRVRRHRRRREAMAPCEPAGGSSRLGGGMVAVGEHREPPRPASELRDEAANQATTRLAASWERAVWKR